MTIQLDLPVVPDGALRGARTPIKQRNPSARHQALLELMKMFPATLLSLVEPDLQIGYPVQGPLTARVSDCDAYGLRIDSRLDYFQPGDTDPVLAIVVEVQLDREDDLRWRLCPYVGFTSHDARCATDIVVLCGNRALAKSLARPMLIGARGSNITPLPIGPGEVPVIDNLEEAMADPGLLMLSGWHHAEDSDETRELLVGLIVEVLQWLDAVDGEKARQYHQLATVILHTPSMRRFKQMTSTAIREYIANEVYPEWTCERGAQDILEVLETREVHVPDDVRAEFLGCQDPRRLTVWLKRSVTAATARDVIAGP
ncbi:MAG: hypothetical protein ABSA93_24995 [Streptosporangiaceae bacterium]|jgi:hypothetical protein